MASRFWWMSGQVEIKVGTLDSANSFYGTQQDDCTFHDKKISLKGRKNLTTILQHL